MPSAAASEPSATSTRLAVAPARSSLATERVMPSRARRAARCAGEPASAGSRPTTTTRAQRPSRFRAGPRVARRASRSAGSLGGGEVDEHAAEPACLGHLLDQGGSGVGQAVAQRGEGRGLGVATDEHRAVDQRSAGHVAAQRHRLGQAEGGRELLAEAGGDEGRVTVAVRHVRPPRGSRRRPGHRRHRSRSGRASRAPSRGASSPASRRCAHRSRRTGVRRRVRSR